MTAITLKSRSFLLLDDGTYPNNGKLALVVYENAFDALAGDPAAVVEKHFHRNGWIPAWRNGLYDLHHYHSSAHEVLGVYSGWVKGRFGGPGGVLLSARAGDVIIVPAGVAHKNVGQSNDFRVVGAYPEGQTWDMHYGRAGERPSADERIHRVPLPKRDPVYGKAGRLLEFWGGAGD